MPAANHATLDAHQARPARRVSNQGMDHRRLATILAAATLPLGAGANGADDRGRTAAAIVQETCVLCHGPGLGGAPRIGDTRAWQKRARPGIDALVRSASQGKGAMPPRGGVPDLTEDELRAAIAYMSGLSSR